MPTRRRTNAPVLPASGQKTCSNCGQTQSVGEFGSSPLTRDGLASWCRTCKRVASRKRRHGELGERPCSHEPRCPTLVTCLRAELAGAYDQVRTLRTLLQETHEFPECPGPADGEVSTPEITEARDAWMRQWEALDRRIRGAIATVGPTRA